MASQGCRGCPDSESHRRPQHCSHCPLRRHCHHCPLHNPHFHANNFPKQFLNPPLPHQQTISSDAQISQELEHIDLDGEEEDDEPVFVLTDEWREFFAKSEARRKLEKKHAKKAKK